MLAESSHQKMAKMRLIQTNGTVTLSPKGRNEVRFSLPKS
jgi:hypothetical protein